MVCLLMTLVNMLFPMELLKNTPVCMLMQSVYLKLMQASMLNYSLIIWLWSVLITLQPNSIFISSQTIILVILCIIIAITSLNLLS
jgi:hypothetical protein